MMKRRKGLPKDFEDEFMAAVLPILKKYGDMNKSHMSKDRIGGIAIIALRRACAIALWGVSPNNGIHPTPETDSNINT